VLGLDGYKFRLHLAVRNILLKLVHELGLRGNREYCGNIGTYLLEGLGCGIIPCQCNSFHHG
jgi:hypothetical protein